MNKGDLNQATQEDILIDVGLDDVGGSLELLEKIIRSAQEMKSVTALGIMVAHYLHDRETRIRQELEERIYNQNDGNAAAEESALIDKANAAEINSLNQKTA